MDARDDEACLRLWSAVLYQAVKDYKSASERERKPIQRWFHSDAYGPGSFIWICQMCQFNERLIRQGIK